MIKIILKKFLSILFLDCILINPVGDVYVDIQNGWIDE